MKKLIKNIARSVGFDVRKIKHTEEARLMRLILTQGVDLILDVGANAGQYGMQMRECGYGGRIVSFEPLPDAHALLLQVAQSDPQWDIAPRMALGSEEGEVEINVAGNSYSSSILPMTNTHVNAAPQSRYIRVEKTPLHRLDAVAAPWLERAEVPFLKIDTQGYEAQVMAGAEGILHRIAGVEVELSLTVLYEGQPLFEDMLALMKRLGFELFLIKPAFTDEATGRLLQADGIFFRP